MQIPIRYQQEQPSQWAQQPSQWETQQQQFSGKQQPQQWGEGTQPWESQKTYIPGKYEQGASESLFGTAQQQQGVGGQQQGFGGQQYGMGKSNIGQYVEKTLSKQVCSNDLSNLHFLVMLTGDCYVKEHVLMRLTQNSEVIQNWHKEVTIKNLDLLVNHYKKLGLNLPFCKTLESREQEIKSKLQQVIPVLTCGEAICSVKLRACILEQKLAETFFTSMDPELKSITQQCCENLCNNLSKLKEISHQCPEFYPAPFVRSVLVREGVEHRR
jgi:hypothetical protein